MRQSTLIEIDMSEVAKKRHDMFLQFYERLQHFAFRAQNILKKENSEVVLFCIAVDTEWRGLVDILMPGTDWQKIRDQELEPVAMGSVTFSLAHDLIKLFPDMREILIEIPPEGFYKCIALDEGGCTIYEIEPKEQK